MPDGWLEKRVAAALARAERERGFPITLQMVDDMMRRRASGETVATIARAYGLRWSTAWKYSGGKLAKNPVH